MKLALAIALLAACAPTWRIAARNTRHPCPPVALSMMDVLGTVALGAGAALAHGVGNDVRAGIELGAAFALLSGATIAEATCE